MIKVENDEEHPRVLIEEWFPFEEIGIECRRERGMSSALPPLNYLHVWWARRPIIASKAAILGSILKSDFSRKDFYKIMKFEKNLTETYKKLISFKKLGKRSPIGYIKPRSFTQNNTSKELELIKHQSIFKNLKIMDTMAGGGSIPFEAISLNLNTIVNELNPVAVIILYATLYFPVKFGLPLMDDILKYGNKIINNVKEKLKHHYFWKDNQRNFQYIWVRTVICPDPNCSIKVPLTPFWDLERKNKKITTIVKKNGLNSNSEYKFSIINNPTQDIIRANEGTMKKGVGTCPKCGNSIKSEYIKQEAQEGRLGHQIIAVIYKIDEGKKKIRKYRAPSKKDIDSFLSAETKLKEKWDDWLKLNIIPLENFPKGSDNRPINYGMEKWHKFFNNRQLLAHLTILEEIIILKEDLLQKNTYNKEYIKAIITYLQIAFDKLIDRNSIQTRWVPSYQRIANTFARHDFSFKSSYAEMDIIGKGYDWTIENVCKAYKGLVDLLGNFGSIPTIFNSPAQNLKDINNEEVDIIVVDPPYYNNVMYAELSDFFYVWMKISLNDLYPSLFNLKLTDKDNEAVANASRFEGMGGSKTKLAKNDYEAKMEKSFKEMNRILQKHGILTIMFTHKATDAWDTLAMSLMEAGFEITASWPVHTEAQLSLHIAKKNSVKTTIFLVCRKRLKKREELWWEDDVLPSIKKAVTKKAKEFRESGIDGVDLFISCFGPALKEFSKSYPVKNIAGDIVRAEEAIEAARKIVIDITLQDIIKGKSYNIDSVSKFYLTAWHFFKARIFPFDEARRLALSVGINIDDLKTSNKLLNKKGSDVILIQPKEREKKGAIDIENPKDNGILINAVHLAILAYETGGQKAFENIIEKLRRNTDKSFRLYMETLFNVLPDVKDLATNLPEKKILGEILMTTEEKITPKGGKITDFID